jgi:hypothetical protein
MFLFGTTNLGFAKETCVPTNKTRLKVEIWLSKKQKRNYLKIRKEFQQMSNTKVGLFVYPGDNPSRIVAIGRCTPVHIAQHFLSKAKKYSLGTTHLVNQGFISSHWSGLGTSLFSENSINPITQNQLKMLMDEKLDTESFHTLYRSFTVQSKTVSAFGLILDNPKLLN